MRKCLLVAVLLLVSIPAFSQVYQAVRTEAYHNVAVYGDTARTDTINTAKYFAGLIVGYFPATQDTILIYSGVKVPTLKLQIVADSTRAPMSITAGFQVDSMIVKRKGTSKVTYLYRTTSY